MQLQSFTLPLLLAWALMASILSVPIRGEETEADGRTFRATLFNEWDGPQLFVKVKSDHEPLDLHQMAYTKPFPYKAGSPITLYSEQTDPESAESRYIPSIRVPVPDAITEPMLILYWDKEKKSGGGKIVEFSARKFPYGTYQFVNLGEAPIAGYIGKKENRFICKGHSELITPDILKNGDRTPIVIHAKAGKETPLVYSTTTIHRSAKRVIVFLTPEVNKLDRLVYRSSTLVDFAPQQDE